MLTVFCDMQGPSTFAFLEKGVNVNNASYCQIFRQNLTYSLNYIKKRVQTLDETDCISHSTNTLGKGMNPIILPPAVGK